MADCCMFAGQGAQVPGMGKDFAESDASLMALFDKANGVLGFDLKKICFEGPAEELTKSNVCQPAIFVVSYAAYTLLQKRRPTAFAVSKNPITSASASAKSLPMPGTCAPCPANMQQSLIVWSF